MDIMAITALLIISFIIILTVIHFRFNNDVIRITKMRYNNIQVLHAEMKRHLMINITHYSRNHVNLRQSLTAKNAKIIWGWSHVQIITVLYTAAFMSKIQSFELQSSSGTKGYNLYFDISFYALIITSMILFIVTIWVTAKVKQCSAVFHTNYNMLQQICNRYDIGFLEPSNNTQQAATDSYTAICAATSVNYVATTVMVLLLTTNNPDNSVIQNALLNVISVWFASICAVAYSIWCTIKFTHSYIKDAIDILHCYNIHNVNNICDRNNVSYAHMCMEYVIPSIPLIGFFLECFVHITGNTEDGQQRPTEHTIVHVRHSMAEKLATEGVYNIGISIVGLINPNLEFEIV